VRYEQLRGLEAHGCKQSGVLIAATEEASGKQLWAVQLYESSFDPAEEQEAQEVHLSELCIDAEGGVLKTRDEHGRV
jgi:hypothetical protein